jgi:hypothetical protein
MNCVNNGNCTVVFCETMCRNVDVTVTMKVVKMILLETGGKYDYSNSFNVWFIYYFMAYYKHTFSTYFHNKKVQKEV